MYMEMITFLNIFKKDVVNFWDGCQAIPLRPKLKQDL